MTATTTARPRTTDPHRRHPDRRRSALITPALLQEWLPVPDAAERLVEDSRAAISRVLHGGDDRLLAIVGPCSIHDHDQALDYAPPAALAAPRTRNCSW